MRYLVPDDFSSDIVVIEKGIGGEEVVYENGESESKLFENILYFHKFKKMFIDDEIASYHDEVARKIIFLSSKHGRLDVEYRTDWDEEFYEIDNSLMDQLEVIKSKIFIDGKYKNFFRESFIDYTKTLTNVDNRFTKSLANITHIVESATRNYELYQHNFSFEEFRKELNEDKEKYLKEYQSNLSDFLSKIASMPIQFGVYIYLVHRFFEQFLPMLLITIVIVAWSSFTLYSVTLILGSVKYLKNKFISDFSMMLEKSGIDETEVENDREQIVDKFKKSICLIKSYWAFVFIFSVCVVAFCIFFLKVSP